MILYCDGDSYVAGTELGDIILPEHPGFSAWPGFNQQRALVWLNRTYRNGDLAPIREQLKTQIAILEKEKAFPNKIAKKLNIEVVNAALGGSSMDAICRRTLSNLIKLKDRDHSMAVIGITDPWRFELPNSSTDAVPWICAHPTTEVDFIKDVVKYMTVAKKKYHGLVKFYKNIITIQDFCKVNNIKLIFIDRKLINSVEKHFEDYEDYVNLKKYSNFKADLDILEIVKNIDEAMCPGHHFNEKAHEVISNMIVELL